MVLRPPETSIQSCIQLTETVLSPSVQCTAGVGCDATLVVETVAATVAATVVPCVYSYDTTRDFVVG